MVEIIALHQVTVREPYQKFTCANGITSFTCDFKDDKKKHTYFFDEKKARECYEELRKELDDTWEVQLRSGYAIKDGQKLASIMCFDDLVPYNEVL